MGQNETSFQFYQDRKSTSGVYQILGGKLVCLSAKKQNSVAMSFAEAEYVVAARVIERLIKPAIVDDTPKVRRCPIDVDNVMTNVVFAFYNHPYRN
ncbi:hypothetical protein Tco_0040478 [Tanacetum coccineum]